MYLTAGEADHPVLKNVVAEHITVSAFTAVEYEPVYDVLLYCSTYPMLLVRNDGANKIAVMPFSVHYSNIVETEDWFFLLYNLINYYLPGTVDTNAVEVNGTVNVNSRGPRITLEGEALDEDILMTEFPATLTFKIPGTYTLKQTSYFPNETLPNVQIFVKIPASESNIWRQEDGLSEPYIETAAENTYEDLLIWLAAALVALLFAEFWLQSRANR